MPGTFTFKPIQANLTHDTDWLGKMDPYCSFRVGPERIKGPICRNGGKFPKWENAVITVPASNEPSIVVDLRDKDKILHDDNIGSFVIDLQEVASTGHLSKWYPVYWNKKPAGEILLESVYQPEIIQQPVIQPVIQQPVIQPVIEPVIPETVLTEEIIQPVVREEVIRVPSEGIHQTPLNEEVVHASVPQLAEEKITWQKDTPIIQGISQIHHSGQGYGLVPQHSSLLSGGMTYNQGTLQQGTIHTEYYVHSGEQTGLSTNYNKTTIVGGSTIGGSTLGSTTIGGTTLGTGTHVHQTPSSNISFPESKY